MKIIANEARSNHGVSWEEAVRLGGSYVFFRGGVHLCIGHFEQGKNQWLMNHIGSNNSIVGPADHSYRDLQFYPIIEMKVTYHK